MPERDETLRLGAARAAAGDSGLVRTVREYLAAHLTEAVMLRELAAHARMSQSALSHRYRQEAGETPMATLTGMRLNRAKGLLLAGHRLDVVAEQTGFYDAFHFSRTFRRHVGVPPKLFRRGAGR